LLVLLQTASTARNPTSTQPLPLFHDITAITKLETHEDAIMITRDEIVCLDGMSLEGDIPDNI
jgi:hypothetical protein